MRFAFTDEQTALRDAIREALNGRLCPGLDRPAGPALGRPALAELSAHRSWGGIGTAPGRGGCGGGAVEVTILIEELARAGAPGSTAISGALARAALATSSSTTAAGELLLRRIACDEVTAALAVRADDGTPGEVEVVDARATGDVLHVLGAPESDVLLVVAAGDLHGVDRRAPGVTLASRDLLDLGRTVGAVTLDHVRAQRLARDVDTAAVRGLAAVLAAADTLGAARGLYDLARASMHAREQDEITAGSSAVRQAGVDMLVSIRTAHAALYHAAWAIDAGRAASDLAVDVAAAFTTAAAARVADAALVLYEGAGFAGEEELQLLLRRTHSTRALYGTSEVHDESLAAWLDLAPAVRTTDLWTHVSR